MRAINRFLLSAGCALVMPALQSAPSITATSGTVTANGTVTITGAGFGTKASAAPLIFDNFEAGTVGTKVMTSRATVGQWQTGAGYEAGQYTDSLARTGSKSVKMTSTPQSKVYNISMCQNGSFSTIYMDWRVRVHLFDRVSRNWKPWRVYGDSDRLQADSVAFCQGSANGVDDGAGGGGFWYDNFGFAPDTWQHFQVMLKESSSPGALDGALIHYIDGKVIGSHTGISTRGNSAHWDQIRIGHYWAYDGVDECPANAGADIYLDDIYVDTTWARVELGNATTYSASTHREIQIPKAWSGSSIQVGVNTGTFQQGATAYLYVTDAAGAVNASGFPVTIGGGAPAAKKVKAPTALRVE
jgi:hypothetical protein